MLIHVITNRNDHVKSEEIITAFCELGWKHGGGGGLTGTGYLFAWHDDAKPIFPKGIHYEVIPEK